MPKQLRHIAFAWIGLVLLLALTVPAAAEAHATLVRSEPRDGSVVETAPSRVRLVFDDDVRALSGMKAIRNGGGSVLSGRPKVVGGRTLVVPLRAGLPNGDYTVLWRVLSDDGHVRPSVPPPHGPAVVSPRWSPASPA